MSIPLYPPELGKQMINSEKKAKKLKYKILSTDKIYKEIMKLALK